MLRQAQLAMLEILKEIDVVCKKHNIQYWLTAGTTLGAVRHQGFIPWDDDLDIAMMKDDYERFIKVAIKDLPSHLFFQNKQTDPGYHKKVAKIRDTRTFIIDSDETENEPYCQGLFVDIFVFGYASSFEIKLRTWEDFLMALLGKKNLFPKGSLKRALFGITRIPCTVIYSCLRFLIAIISQRTNKNQFIATTADQTTWSFFHEASDVFPLKDIEFEKHLFPGPANLDNFLTRLYGDWQTIPSKENQRSHGRIVKV